MLATERMSAKPRVLAVDDDRTNLEVITGFLGALGYSPDVAHNGAEGLQMMQSGAPYAVVLMDCQMPVMDGYTASREIREWERNSGRDHTPIVAVTAHVRPGERERVLEAGMDDYLPKPVKLMVLREMLKSWMSGARPTGSGADGGGPPTELNPGVASTLESLRNLKGQDFIAGVVRVFREDAEASFEQLAGLIALPEWDAVRSAAHKLKGSSRAVGAFGVADAAQHLEAAAQNRDASLVSHLQSAKAAYRAIAPALDALAGNEDARD